MAVDTLSYRTVSANKETVDQKWLVIDAEGEIAGRMFTQVAHFLRGKHKPFYTPHVDCGDYVIIINASKLRFTGNKIMQKEYITFSGYPGGQKRIVANELLKKSPRKLVEFGVRRMLPKTKLGRAMIKKLHIYDGAEHPHEAQKPELITFNNKKAK